MKDFKRETLKINGVDTVLYTAGRGEPLLFLHGAGTWHGWEFARPWAEKYKVILPHHPGFGESGDDPAMGEFHDYVMHYVDLLDTLGIDRVNLVGFSLGGFLAAQFASQHSHRVKKLALIGPGGMRDKKYPAVDILSTPGEELVGMLAVNMDVVKPFLPTGPDPDFMAARYREATTVARLMWEKPWDPKFRRYLHRVKMPTLVVWGEEDKIIPVQQSEIWKKVLPNAQIRIFKGVGHLVLDEAPESVKAVSDFFA